MGRPLVSIITPCFNGESYLDRYFSSILNQTYAPLEVIFVNDGSVDRTEEIAVSYQKDLEAKGIRFIYLYQKNAGQAAALNRGLKLFAGEYLTWPDADDEMSPDCIEQKVAYLQNHPECDMCICRVEQILEGASEEIIPPLERIPPVQNDDLFEDLIFLKNVFFCPGGYMVRKAAVDIAIPNREIYAGPGGQNAQILLPIAYRKKYGYINDILYTYYIRTNSHSHSQNTPEKTIVQFKNFERIILETLKKMDSGIYGRYQKKVQRYYAYQRFEIALGTHNGKLIKQYFREAKDLRAIKKGDWLRSIRYAFLYFLVPFGKQ